MRTVNFGSGMDLSRRQISTLVGLNQTWNQMECTLEGFLVPNAVLVILAMVNVRDRIGPQFFYFHIIPISNVSFITKYFLRYGI